MTFDPTKYLIQHLTTAFLTEGCRTFSPLSAWTTSKNCRLWPGLQPSVRPSRPWPSPPGDSWMQWDN